MQLTATVASAILAFTSLASARPSVHERRQQNNEVKETVKKLLVAPTAVDRFEILDKNEDFLINIAPPDTPAGRGGATAAANRGTFPAVVGTSASMVVGRIDACGINSFHNHPRSAELQLLISGSIVTEMVPENGVMDKDGKARVIRQELKKPFDLTVFPQGSVHHQFNPECDPAVFVASFADEDPGTNQVENAVFLMDDGAIFPVLAGEVDLDTIADIKKNIPPSLVAGFLDCQKKCFGKDYEKAPKDAPKEAPKEDKVDEKKPN